MKHLATAVALTALASTANAGFDGIYKHPVDDIYYSVHQSGATLRIASFGSLYPAPGYDFLVSADGLKSTPLYPPRLDVWGLFAGPIRGAQADLSGENPFGFCTSILNVQLNNDGSLTFRVVGAVPTAAALRRKFNCVLPSVPVFTAPRVG